MQLIRPAQCPTCKAKYSWSKIFKLFFQEEFLCPSCNEGLAIGPDNLGAWGIALGLLTLWTIHSFIPGPRADASWLTKFFTVCATIVITYAILFNSIVKIEIGKEEKKKRCEDKTNNDNANNDV
jgi:hypothetical protein